jgi:hypothetical protein
MMFKTPHKISAVALSLMVGAAVMMTACDVFEKDVEPNRTIPDNEVHMLKNTSTYIDVNARLNTSEPISISISKTPIRGSVTEVSSGLLKYVPNSSFNSGEDAFTYNVYNAAQQLVTSHSVIIVLEADSTDLPCGIYPEDDYFVVGREWFDEGDGFYADVLANDILCGDSIDMKLEVYRAPAFGTATTVGQLIQYYSTKPGSYVDSLIYKVSKISDTTVFGYATLSIHVREVNCEDTVYNDFLSFDRMSFQPDSVELPVLQNDLFCDSVLSLTVIDGPYYGQVRSIYNPDIGRTFQYAYDWPDSLAAINDSLRYEVCTPQGCKTATTVISIH